MAQLASVLVTMGLLVGTFFWLGMRLVQLDDRPRRPRADPVPGTGPCCTEPHGGAAGIEQDEAAMRAHQAAVLADPFRQRLLSRIADARDGGACLCELVGQLGRCQTTESAIPVARHLSVLLAAGLVVEGRRGRCVTYRAAPVHRAPRATAQPGRRPVSRRR